jgi:hypothetical protein
VKWKGDFGAFFQFCHSGTGDQSASARGAAREIEEVARRAEARTR